MANQTVTTSSAADAPTVPGLEPAVRADPTLPLPASATPIAAPEESREERPRPPGPRRGWLGPAGVVMAVVLGVAGGVVVAGDDDPLPPPEPVVTVPPETNPPGTVAPTMPGPFVSTLPMIGGARVGSITALMDFLARNPNVYGTRGDDLVDKLRDLAADGVIDLKERASFARDVSGWVRAGELDARIGALAAQLVAVLPTSITPDDDADSRGPGASDDDGRGSSDHDGDD